MLRRAWARLKATVRPSRQDEEFRAELQAHLDMIIEERMAGGLTREQAVREATLRLGGTAQIEEAHREWRSYLWWDAIGADTVAAAKGLRRGPRFAATVVLTTAVAIGAATAVFSVVDHSLLRPLPRAADDRLVSIGIQGAVVSSQDWLFAGTFQEWQAQVERFEALAAWKGLTECDRNDGAAERLACALVDHQFLSVLGVTPLLGRNFTEAEDQPGAAPAVILSHAYWRSRFGGDPRAVGKQLTIDGTLARIAGVLPPGFEGPMQGKADLLLPLQLRQGSQRQRLVQVIGRVRAGVPLFAARMELGFLFDRFAASAPHDFRMAVPMKLRVERLRDRRMREYRTGLFLLFGAVLCFLLMACAAAASMQLARSEARRQDYAVRRSLGATPARLLQQAMIESLLLAGLGGALGLALAALLMQAFANLRPTGAPPEMQAALDGRVAAFALLLSLLSAALFGAMPALARLRTESLAGARIAGARQQRLRSALVALQFAISMVLLSATGLLLLSLTRLQQVQLGFRAENVVTASFLLPAAVYGTEERQIAFFQDLENRLRDMPGVTASAITDSLPPDGDPRSFPFVVLLGGGNAADVQGLVKWRYVTPGYFAALGIPIRQGRGFAGEDRGCGAQPLVLSESLARRLFPDGSAVGRTIPWGLVVGVAADVRNAGIRQLPDPEMYVLRCSRPSAVSGNQRPPHGWRLATAVVRSSLPEAAATALLAQTIRNAGPGLAVASQTLHQDLRGEVSQTRFQTALLSVFAIIGVALAAIGLYGLTSFLAVARTREVGVRMALGATRGNIAWLMARNGVAWTAAGLAAGSVVSLWVMQAMRSLLVDATAADIAVMVAAIAVLALAALAGMAGPSARASRLEAVEALREG